MNDLGDNGALVAQTRGFDRNSGSLAERLLFNNRPLVVLLCFAVTLTLAFQLSHLRLNAGYEKMIPLHHPFIVNYTENKSELSGLGNTLKLAVETTEGTIFSATYMETLRQINDEVFLLPGVDRAHVQSLWMSGVRWIAVTEDGMEGGPVIPDRFGGSPQDLIQLRANVLRSGQIGLLVASDFRSSTIVLPLLDRDAAGKPLDYHELSGKLEEIRHKYERGPIKVRIVGFAKLVGDLIDALAQVLTFFAIAIVICTLVLYWHTRCWRSTLLVMGCSLLAVFWLLGLLPTLGYELDPYSILVPFLVFAIGMSHGAQKMNGIMQDIGRGTHRLAAARHTFRRLFVAGATALLADAVGFGVLMLIPIQIIQDLAVTASLGVAALIFTNLVLLPILLSYVGVSRKGAARSLRQEADPTCSRNRLWIFLDLFAERRWASVAICSGIALAVVGYAASRRLQIGDLEPGAPELRHLSRYNRDDDFIVSRYAASSDVYVVMVKTKPFQCNTYGTLSRVDALEWQLQQIPQVDSTNSFARLARNATVAMNEGSFAWYDVPRNQGLLNSITNRGAPRELINQGCDLITVYAYLKDHKARTLERVVAVAEAFAAANSDGNVQFLSAAGNAGIEAATNIVVKQANTRMLWLVYAAVTVLAFVTFRSWRAVLCAIVPLAVTTILAESLMVALGIGVKVATLPVLALGVGIGVDYALYVLTVTLAELRQGRSLSQAYFKALLFTGRVVVLTGITLSIAVFTWIFSPIKFQADMGVLLAFMFLWNMLGALILLPALAHFLLPTVPVRAAHAPGTH